MKIVIDGEVEDVKVRTGSYLPMLQDGKREWYVAEDEEAAGKAAREYWKDLAEKDPQEFVAIIGAERLVQWALGQNDSYGFSSLEDFLEAVEGVPEEEFADYDGNILECTTQPSDEQLIEAYLEHGWDGVDLDKKEDLESEVWEEFEEIEHELGFVPTVAYRHN